MLYPMPQPQQRGAQLREAIKDRAAQEHDRAAEDVAGQAAVRQPVYPAGRMEDERKPKGAPVRQHNNAPEATGGDLPDPKRAEAFDQDEG